MTVCTTAKMGAFSWEGHPLRVMADAFNNDTSWRENVEIIAKEVRKVNGLYHVEIVYSYDDICEEED